MTQVYGIIYQAFDTSNGKSYIGQTVQSIKVRKLQHFDRKSNSRKFRNGASEETKQKMAESQRLRRKREGCKQ